MTTQHAWLAAACFAVFALTTIYQPPALQKQIWLLPAVLAFGFSGFSMYAALTEGLT